MVCICYFERAIIENKTLGDELMSYAISIMFNVRFEFMF